MRLELSKRIFLNFVVVIATFCVLGALLGVHLINRNILNEAQRRVRLNLRSGWSVIHSEIDQIGLFVSALVPGSRVAKAFDAPESQVSRASLEAARQKCGFDFLSLTDAGGRVILRTLEPYHKGDYLANDAFVSGALKGKTTSGLAILGRERLRTEGGNLEERAFIAFEPTAKAQRRAKTAESAGMAIIAAAPVQSATGEIIGALYAGVLLNRNHALVDKIRIGFVREEKNFRFEVWNDGKALSPDKTARLFGKFVRFNQETDTSRSAGLGLFITREIITKHSGKIWVESEEGRWINFLFTLPKEGIKNSIEFSR